jgi:hypothetical protein
MTRRRAFNTSVDNFNQQEVSRERLGATETANASRHRFLQACPVEELYYLRREGKISRDEKVPSKRFLEDMTLAQLNDYNAHLSGLLVFGRKRWEREQYMTLVDHFYVWQEKYKAEDVKTWMLQWFPDFPGTSKNTTPNLGNNIKHPTDMDSKFQTLLNQLWNHPHRQVYLEKLEGAQWLLVDQPMTFSEVFFAQWEAKQPWFQVLHLLATMYMKHKNGAIPHKVWEDLRTKDLNDPNVLQELWVSAVKEAAKTQISPPLHPLEEPEEPEEPATDVSEMDALEMEMSEMDALEMDMSEMDVSEMGDSEMEDVVESYVPPVKRAKRGMTHL